MEGSKDIRECFYKILGVQKSCTPSEIRSAYRRLAMIWHPDKCAAGDSVANDNAKSRFQAIQEAYSVLSDDDRRFLYDAGVLETDADQEYGMSDFLGEITSMMKDANREGEGGTYEELRDLFMKIIDGDVQAPADRSEKPTMLSEEEDFYNNFLAENSTLNSDPFFTDTFCAGASSSRSFESSKSGQEKCSRKRKSRHTHASASSVTSDYDGGSKDLGVSTS
ncbi:hypothetical protein O6H91_02G142600 [Diphasiastrum complanatum]|uniref:Uncharacterized protein n=1 Tax=Diphasiastrum complanatum TaxID=34168 RepID=A0ACC2EL56_DIPCM|nr:hypothetical protein O6H91_02G142600 [Diphasiastrum complanatum]